ncbi:hypothetical protein RND71_019253 [Anisodus tanguticus]|uniref:Uncharacterized protein n=1 Tax=Anisodus tanguticus TaxID=243964 RepID=A0AAE1RYR5_9SOLA|nr:hypothetical protein RND71_019253 [Anisodus tanguticus]
MQKSNGKPEPSPPGPGEVVVPPSRHLNDPYYRHPPPPQQRHMRNYNWDDLERLSRMRRLRNIEMEQSRTYRINFRDYADDYYYNNNYYDPRAPPPPSPMPAPPPLPEYSEPVHPPPPLPMNYLPSYFSDDNPQGCAIM